MRAPPSGQRRRRPVRERRRRRHRRQPRRRRSDRHQHRSHRTRDRGVSHRPPANAAGWNNGPVTPIDFTCTDALSGIDTCAAVPKCWAAMAPARTRRRGGTDIAGNHAVAEGHPGINIDRTAPSIPPSRRTPANAAGWNNTAVTVSFVCADALVGHRHLRGRAPVLGSDGSGQSASGEAVDIAGKSRRRRSHRHQHRSHAAGRRSDRHRQQRLLQSRRGAASCRCTTTDALSGVAASAVVAVNGGTSNGVGTFTATCAGARDLAGNTNDDDRRLFCSLRLHGIHVSREQTRRS